MILNLFGSPLAPRPAVALLQLSIPALLLHNKLLVER